MAIRRRLIQKEGEVRYLERYEILDAIDRVKGNNPLRDKALICFLYLTGARIEEVVYYKEEKPLVKAKRERSEERGKILGYPIQKRQVTVEPNIIIINGVRCLKRRDNIKRNIPIIRNKKEKPFISIFLSYLETIPDDKTYLWDLSRSRVTRILEKVNLFPHWLRHCRSSVLVKEYNFTGQLLQKYNGWTRSSSGDTYVHLYTQDLVNQLLLMGELETAEKLEKQLNDTIE